MRKRTIVAVAFLALSLGVAVPASAATQPPGTTVNAGLWAAGGDLGVSNRTGDGQFRGDPQLGGFFEHFTSDHVSWRGSLTNMSTADPRFRGPARDLDITSVDGNVLYTWEGQYVHPFVTGGVGVYAYDPRFGGSDLKLGANVGGGVNLYVTRTSAVKLEGLFHETSASREPDSFFAATAGMRFQW